MLQPMLLSYCHYLADIIACKFSYSHSLFILQLFEYCSCSQSLPSNFNLFPPLNNGCKLPGRPLTLHNRNKSTIWFCVEFQHFAVLFRKPI